MSKIIDVTVGNSLRNLFGEVLIKYKDLHFQVFDCDVTGGVGTAKFRELYPDRITQCGIAEQGAMGVACGYALATGQPAIMTTFAVFGLRALEIFRLSAAYNNANVKLVLSHIGLDVGPDGASAQAETCYGVWRTIPNTIVIHPSTPRQMDEAVKWMLEYPGPVIMLTGRSPIPANLPDIGFELNCPNQVQWGNQATVITAGNLLGEVLKATDGKDVDVFVLSTIESDNDFSDIRTSVNKTKYLVTVEDGNVEAGIGEMIAASMPRLSFEHIRLGMATFGESGEGPELWAKYGLDATGIQRWL